MIFAVIWPERDRLETMVTADPAMLLPTFQELGLKVFGAVLAIVTVIALADYVYQRQRWWNRLKMTVQEVRDEYKQMEGDPKVKGRIRPIRNERSRQPHDGERAQGDRRDHQPDPLCGGAEVRQHHVGARSASPRAPTMWRSASAKWPRSTMCRSSRIPPLARALFAAVDIDETIPTEHFKAVAQVIGFVMRMKDKKAWSA